MIKLFGNARSRAVRCLWMLEEIGAPYELVETSVRVEDLRNPEYLRLNPNARIPTLVDGEVVLWESMAINLYLAGKPGPMELADGAALTAFSGPASRPPSSPCRSVAARVAGSPIRRPLFFFEMKLKADLWRACPGGAFALVCRSWPRFGKRRLRRRCGVGGAHGRSAITWSEFAVAHSVTAQQPESCASPGENLRIYPRGANKKTPQTRPAGSFSRLAD
jgi:hypothetical protein